MNAKTKDKIDNFLEGKEFKTKEELTKAIEEFMNSKKEYMYEETELDVANKLLEKARKATSKTQTKKLAKEAYDTCRECFDAYLYYVKQESNILCQQQLLIEGLEKEKDRLKKNNFFTEDCIGNFYSIFETRAYIIGLNQLVHLYIKDGKMFLAATVSEEIIRLNKSDNTNTRFLLMAIYAYLEEKDKLVKITKKYNYECLESLVPLMCLYYKQNNYTKAKKYLDKINECNPYFKKYYQNYKLESDSYIEGYYQRGSASEIIKYTNNYSFLLKSILTLKDFILKNGKI